MVTVKSLLGDSISETGASLGSAAAGFLSLSRSRWPLAAAVESFVEDAARLERASGALSASVARLAPAGRSLPASSKHFNDASQTCFSQKLRMSDKKTAHRTQAQTQHFQCGTETLQVSLERCVISWEVFLLLPKVSPVRFHHHNIALKLSPSILGSWSFFRPCTTTTMLHRNPGCSAIPSLMECKIHMLSPDVSSNDLRIVLIVPLN